MLYKFITISLSYVRKKESFFIRKPCRIQQNRVFHGSCENPLTHLNVVAVKFNDEPASILSIAQW